MSKPRCSAWKETETENKKAPAGVARGVKLSTASSYHKRARWQGTNTLSSHATFIPSRRQGAVEHSPALAAFQLSRQTVGKLPFPVARRPQGQFFRERGRHFV